MHSWDKLPTEVLLQILFYLKNSPSTLQQCQLTCRTWRDPAQKQFHKAVKLESPEQAELFIRTMSDPSNYASKWVRSLALGRSLCEAPSMEFIFPQLFDLCPNIFRLEAPPGQSSSFWAKLLLEHSKGNVSHLREIPLTDLSCDDNIKLYGYAAFVLRNHLTSLTMCDWPSKNPSFRNDKVAIQLKDFLQLKKLDIHLRGSKSIYEVFSFIQHCPTLQSVNCSVTDINRNLHDYVEENDQDPNWYDIQQSPLTNIERLNVEYIPITSKIIRYIIHLFPNLKELYFKSDNPNWEEDMDLLHRVQIEGLRISTDLWLEFLLHLVKHVPRFDVSNLFIADLPNVLEKFIQLTDYGETMRLVYLERDTFFDFQPYIGIDSESGSRKFTQGHNFYDYRTVEVVYAAEEDYYDVLPHLSVLERVGAGLKGLEIEIFRGNQFADSGTDLYNMACGYFLDHTFRTCPFLNTLTLTNCCLFACDPNSGVISDSLQVLRLKQCKIIRSILTSLSARLPNLSYLMMHCRPHIFIDEPLESYEADILFDMPHTSFNCIRITQLNLWCDYPVHLKVVRSQMTSYFIIDQNTNKVSPSSAEVHEKPQTHMPKISMGFKCREIKHLVLESDRIDIAIHFEGSFFRISPKPGSLYASSIKELQL